MTATTVGLQVRSTTRLVSRETNSPSRVRGMEAWSFCRAAGRIKKTSGEEHTLVTDASDRCGPGAEALRNVTKFKTCVMTSPWTQHGQVTVAGAHASFDREHRK